ncbi:MAG: MFS transporter [Puniceicoccaceae bacterium]|nr:MAG: MFS transporter [Puniceicoccaceae bacterium]
MTEHSSVAPAGVEPLPAAAGNLFCFQSANAVCWSILLGFPMVLYFQSMGASATVLGIVMGAAPLLTVLQIPAAGFIEKVGYRRFVFTGWAVRSIFAVGMVLVVLFQGRLGGTASVLLMLLMLLAFSTARGFASAGILPWFTQLIPEKVRGRYLSLEQICMLAVVTFVSLSCGLVFHLLPGRSGFLMVIATGALFGMICLIFLRRIPDVEIEATSRSRQPIPWAALLGHRNFRRILLYNFVTLLAWTGSSIMVVPLLRDEFGLGNGAFMAIHASAAGASILGLFILRKSLDRSGSKPLLKTSILLQGVHFTLWGLIATRIIPLNWVTLVLVQGSWGCVHALYQTSNMRLVMQVIPPMGRSHFFAIFSVSNSLALGLLPVLWGFSIDLLGGFQFEMAGVTVNRYTLLYAAVTIFALSSMFALARIEESDTLSMSDFLNELLVKSPSNALSRVVLRRPIFK